MKTPSSWNDMTAGQYQKLLLVETENKITQSIEKIAIICDCDPEEIRALPYVEYLKLSEKLIKLLQSKEKKTKNKKTL
jgi:hypothetical protein